LRGHTSGYAVPTYVVDAPGGGGKIPVMPNYLISYSDHKIVLRNYEGYITTYEEPLEYRPHDKAACASCRNTRPEPGQSGVHGLLQGERMWIEPKGFEDVHLRGNVEAHRLQRPDKWIPYGVGAIEGTATAPLTMLQPGTTEPGETATQRAASEVNAGIVEPNDLVPEEQRPPAPASAYGPGEEPRPREGEPTGAAHGELL
jgi:hypothetical protein